jgi:cell division protein FtsL
MESVKVELLFSLGVASFTIIGSFVIYLLKKGIDTLQSSINDHGKRLDFLEQKVAALNERDSIVTKMIESRLDDISSNINRIYNKIEETDRNIALLWKSSRET